jgi:hypothetical protein
MAQQPIVDQGLLVIEGSRSHSDPPRLVGFLCTSDQPERRDFYVYNTQNSQETDIRTLAGLEPAIPASERPQTHALDRAATGIGFGVRRISKCR